MRRLLALTAAAAVLVAAAPASATHLSAYYEPPGVYPQLGRVVYVENHARAAWQVPQAAVSWDTGTPLVVRLGRCKPARPCVRVYAGYYGLTGWAGAAWAPVSGGRIVGPVTIRLNETYAAGYPAAIKLHISCHELGHGLAGIRGHRTDTARYSCMGPAAPGPDSVDRALVAEAYAGVPYMGRTGRLWRLTRMD